jgi:LCP family protein required for cell wall assembly
MKRQERLKLRRRRRTKRVLQVLASLVLLGGLVLGALNFDAVKGWAAKHYLRIRFQPAVIAPEDNPDLFAELSKWHNPEENLNLLLIGIDRGSVPGEEGYTRSDVMIVASVNVKAKRAVLVSIPRDTKVTIEGYGTEKINAAHSFRGPAGAVEAVEKLTGLDIHHYAEVDFEAFKNIVDAMGGVPFHLDVTINDPKTGYLEKGDHLLNGQEALILVRSRKLPRGDLDRIEHQKAFLKAVMQKAVSIRDMQTLLKILDTTVRYLETTLEPGLIFTLAEALQGMKVEDVEFATLPGYVKEPPPGQPWYFIHDPKATAELFSNIQKYCSTKTPEERQAELEKERFGDLAGGESQVDRSTVNLAVLNGVRWEGMAAGVAEIMRGKGYKKIKVGNTVHAYEETTVYYAPGNASAARQVAKDLDPDAGFRMVEDQDVAITYDADVILVIGKDYVKP